MAAMLNGLRLFKIGASFGGFESLITPPRPEKNRSVKTWQPDGFLLRVHIGMETVEDLIADLEDGFSRLAATP